MSWAKKMSSSNCSRLHYLLITVAAPCIGGHHQDGQMMGGVEIIMYLAFLTHDIDYEGKYDSPQQIATRIPLPETFELFRATWINPVSWKPLSRALFIDQTKMKRRCVFTPVPRDTSNSWHVFRECEVQHSGRACLQVGSVYRAAAISRRRRNEPGGVKILVATRRPPTQADHTLRTEESS